MGRRLYDNEDNFVWKYAFGGQPSEVCRIDHEYGIGSYVDDPRGPDYAGRMVFTKEDIDALGEMVNEKENRAYVADFLVRERNLYKSHYETNELGERVLQYRGASFDDVKAFAVSMKEKYGKDDIYFIPMCRHIWKKGRDYFRRIGDEGTYELQDEY